MPKNSESCEEAQNGLLEAPVTAYLLLALHAQDGTDFKKFVEDSIGKDVETLKDEFIQEIGAIIRGDYER